MGESLERMGYAVTALAAADLTADRLRRFDAVVLGVRAFNTRNDLAPGLPALFAYAAAGGTVIVQYQTQEYDHNYGPYPFALSGDPEKVVDRSFLPKP